MPHSTHHSLTAVLEHVTLLQPIRVLDIGIGYGKWGYLIREALDFIPGRLDRKAWKTIIDGIEAFPVDSPLYDWVYDRVIIGDALGMLENLHGYDMVILGDVIEHFTKADGLRLLTVLLANNRNAIVATPFDFFEQEIGDNHYEHHLSHWGLGDFAPWPYDYEVVDGAALVVLLAGAGSQYPTGRTSLVSRTIYSLPGMARKGATARVLKQLMAIVFRNALPPRP